MENGKIIYCWQNCHMVSVLLGTCALKEISYILYFKENMNKVPH